LYNEEAAILCISIAWVWETQMLWSWKKDKDVQELIARLEKEHNLDYAVLNRIDNHIHKEMLKFIVLFGIALLLIWFKVHDAFWYVSVLCVMFLMGIYYQESNAHAKYVRLVNSGLSARCIITKYEKWINQGGFYGWLYWYYFYTQQQEKIVSFHKISKVISKESCKDNTIDVLYLKDNPEVNTLSFPKMIDMYNVKMVR
jgi:hypothetical protein